MGLDMDLKLIYKLEAQWNNVTGTFNVYKNGVKVPIALKDISYIECNLVYWRKANQIHEWFVNHIQNGKDDCKEYKVSKEAIKELIETCKKVLENHDLAEELLPTQGFIYFGSTDYDESYFECLKYTVQELSKLDLDSDDISYWYQSSW